MCANTLAPNYATPLFQAQKVGLSGWRLSIQRMTKCQAKKTIKRLRAKLNTNQKYFILKYLSRNKA